MNGFWGRHALWVLAVAPLLPQVIGSIFNIWYNSTIIIPALDADTLRRRFHETVIFFNAVVYPAAAGCWIYLVFSLKKPVAALRSGREVPGSVLTWARRRAINLPWMGSLLAGVSWLLCIPAFLGALVAVDGVLPTTVWFHLPISFLVSAVIAITHSFFLVELASQKLLFPIVFADARADQTPGAWALSLRGRGLLWAVSAGICPIGSLLLLAFAPASPGQETAWFALFVGSVGMAFGLCSALMINRLVAEPVEALARAARRVSQGDLSVEVSGHRADEFGLLVSEFNQMVADLRQKALLRERLGLHVGEQATERILARDPGLSGVEEIITVMFVDIREFTARTQDMDPEQAVRLLNLFLGRMVAVVEEKHHGMINKFLGDGFMALFGIDEGTESQAVAAVAASIDLLEALKEVNREIVAGGQAPLSIGVGLHTGLAVVGSIGSPHRLEFTAIGATVNLASRIEALTKTLQVPILLTEAVRGHLPDDFAVRDFPPQEVKGVDAPVRVYSPVLPFP